MLLRLFSHLTFIFLTTWLQRELYRKLKQATIDEFQSEIHLIKKPQTAPEWGLFNSDSFISFFQLAKYFLFYFGLHSFSNGLFAWQVSCSVYQYASSVPKQMPHGFLHHLLG
jgi:hypothetical protein